MRILIVDDHELVRGGVRSALAGRGDFDICGEAVDGSDAIEKAAQLKPDVIVMDVSMPKLNGLDATREILRILPQAAVLVLSQHDSPEMMRQALNAGARGYVVKSAIAANLIGGIDKVRSGELFFDSAAIKLPERNGDKNLDVKAILQRSEAFERALRESEERFRLAFEQAAVGMAHVALDGRLLRVNRKLAEILGYTQEELQARTFQELTYPADLPDGMAHLRRLKAGEIDQYVLEKRYIRSDNQVVWVKLTVAAVRDAEGGVKYFVGIVEDIHAQKDAEERLLASEDRLRALLDFQTAAMSNTAEGLHTLDEKDCLTSINPAAEAMFGWSQRQAQQADNLLAAIVDSSDDAIVSKTLDGVITSWNKSAERLFGYTAAEAIGQNMMMLVPSGRRQEEIGILERIGCGERINHFETVRRHKNGSLVDVSISVSPVKDSAGRVVGASNVSRDITDRRRAERFLGETARQQRALFHLADQLHRAISMEEICESAMNAILEALPCDRASILLTDEQGHMRFASWRGLSDAYRKSVDGHSTWQPDEPNPQPVYVENVDIAPVSTALHAIKLEGIRALAFIPLASDGKLIGNFSTYFDSVHTFSEKEVELCVTVGRTLASAIKRKRYEEALLKSDERLRAMAENLDAQVRARTAELEMRSAEVYEQSELLRDLSGRLLQAQDDERRRIARELHDSVGQILTVLGLNIASLAMHTPALPADVADTVEQSERLLEQLNREIRTMSYLLHPPLLDESGLPEALRWYIGGLQQRSKIDIDLEISPDFGRLSPDTELVIFRIVQEGLTNIHRHSRSEMAVIRLVRNDEEISVEIQDWGTGIPPERLKVIQSHGSGVGLRGMRERVRQLHGDLRIESNADGTRVCVAFPASAARTGPPLPEKSLAT